MKVVDKMSMRELRSELRSTRPLLALARCPNPGCLDGSIAHQVGHNEWEQEQCQWCYERGELIDAGN
jgi:hypothetical protein